MSDTPETDAVAAIEGNWDTKALRMTDHACKLERERNLAISQWEICIELSKKLERERDDAKAKYDILAVENMLEVHKLCKERDEWAAMCGRYKQERDEAREVASGLSIQEERVEEAQKELSSIHRWIDKNHADGFIDSLTYLQNLERVADNWYDRLDRLEIDAGRLERERDEARKHLRDANKGAEINSHINQKFAQQIIDAREENKNLKLQLGLWEDGNLICEETLGEIRLLKEQIDRILLNRNEAHKIADRVIDDLAWFSETNAQKFRAELDQLKEGAK